MRSSFALLAFVLSAAPLAGQEPWVTAVGVQGGYSRLKPAGTNQPDQIDMYQIPGNSLLDIFGTYGALYGIIPISGGKRLAIEPSFRFTQHSPTPVTGTTIQFGLRADVAIQKGLYAAAGPQLNYVEGGGSNERQVGVQVGVGYRLRLSSVLDGRVEAQGLFFHNASLLPAYNVYSLLFGVAGHLPHAASGTQARHGAQAAGPRPIWRWALGAMGGYTRSHINGGGDLATFSLPGSGASNATLASGAPPGQPTLFVIAPIHDRLAVEVGFDFQQSLPIGNATVFSGNLAPRLNVAVAQNWYGAIGAREYLVRVTDAIKTSAVSGLQVAWGYRFDLASGGGVRGRAEVNYAMFSTNHTVGTPAFNSLSFAAGVAVPLK